MVTCVIIALIGFLILLAGIPGSLAIKLPYGIAVSGSVGAVLLIIGILGTASGLC